MSTSGSTGKNQQDKHGNWANWAGKATGMFWEHSMTFYDILPWLSNIHEARLTDDS